MTCATAMPTSYLRANTHRVVLLQPGNMPPDSERLVELLADGLRAARQVLLAHGQHPATRRAVDDAAARLREHVVVGRRLCADDVRGALEGYASALRASREGRGTAPEVEVALEHLERALEVSHRVDELLAAEAAVRERRA